MIKSAYLENWKTHHSSTFEFAKGTNVIVGKMGSGKSSIMDAISFALYGTFPSLAARKVSLEETIMSKPLKQDRAVVRLEFDYGGKGYTVERTVKRSGINEGSLKENGHLIAGPKTTDVTKKITEILEVSYDLFSRAIYSEQNQIDYFLRLSPAQRKEKFDELLGLDKYEKVRANAVTLANQVKKTAEDRKSFLTEQKKKIDGKELADLESRILQKEKEISQKTLALEAFEKDLIERENEVKKLEETGRIHKKLREAEVKAKSRIDSFSDEIARMKKKLDGTEGGKIKPLLEKAQESLRDNLGKKKALEKELAEAQKEVVSLKERRAAQKNALETGSKSLAGAKSIGAQCPICKRPMSEHDRTQLESELAGAQEKIKLEISSVEKLLENAAEQSRKIEGKIKETEKEKDLLSAQSEELRRLGEISSEILEKEKSKSELEKELVKISGEIGKAGFDEKRLSKVREEFYALRESCAKSRLEIKSSREIVKELELGAKRIREIEEQIKKLEAEAAEQEKAAEKLAIFNSALRQTQAELRNAMIETINEAMDEIWQKIYPYGDYTSARIMVEEGSYEIVVKQLNGEWARVEGILSGGERSSVALTMRIAVSLVLTQNLGWIILDEPTHNLDANSVKELSETMRTHLPEIIGQVFIITHDKEMEYAASGKLYVLEREKESDGVTKIAGE